MTSTPRFPDLIGKAVIAVGSSELLVALAAQLAANRMLIAVVAPDRDLVRAAVAAAEELGVMVNGFTVDAAGPAVWERIRPHIEQRLGPIDVVICQGTDDVRTVTVAALLPDMTARKRGVIIEIDTELTTAVDLGEGVRHCSVDARLSEAEIVGTVARLASDTTAS